MADALFAYVNYQGIHRLVKVRGCRDKEQVRQLLERLLDTPVTVR